MNENGETIFLDNPDGSTTTTFVSNESKKVIIVFNENIHIVSITINDNNEIKNYDLLNYDSIPKIWDDIINSIISLTNWHKLDVKR